MYGIRKFAPLNTNVTRNDYRTLRVQNYCGEIIAGADDTLTVNNFRFPLSLGYWTSAWMREINAYNEFRFSNVQFVLTPRTIYPSQATTGNTCDANEIPYLAVRHINANSATQDFLSSEEVRRTPGYRFLKLTSRRRFIINAKPSIRVSEEVINQQGGITEVIKHRPMPWTEITPATTSLNVAAIEIRKGTFNTGGQRFHWDVSVYATLHLRGNKEELIQPD